MEPSDQATRGGGSYTPGIGCPGRFDEQLVTLFLRDRAMFDVPGDDEELARWESHGVVG
jgi:hypothetical protein